ncbi:MAG: hypothetical protein ACI4WM_04085 [Erysipelotrichaceae bacterium]
MGKYRIDSYETLNDVIYENFQFFNNVFLNKIVLIPLSGKFLAIEINNKSLKHILVFHKSYNYDLNTNPRDSYLYVKDCYKEHKDIIAIRKDKFDSEELSFGEIAIIDRNLDFIEVMNSLINNPKIFSHKKLDVNSQMKYEYFHYLEVEFDGIRLCLTGGENNNFFYISSLINQLSRGEKPFEIHGKVKLYSKEEFKKLNGIDLVHSPNYKTEELTIKKNRRKKTNIDKKNINRINNNLKNGFKIVKGSGKKSQYHLSKDGIIIKENIQDLVDASSIEELISQISKLIQSS